MMMHENKEMLRRQSMELLKELTEILRRMISSGDEQSLCRLRESIRALCEVRRQKEGRSKAAGGGLHLVVRLRIGAPVDRATVIGCPVSSLSRNSPCVSEAPYSWRSRSRCRASLKI